MMRQRRMAQMRDAAKQRQQWLAQGHGVYSEIPEEKLFFAEVKKSERVVCHFYRENWPCKVMDKHLADLAPLHPEARFIKINAEKSPYLCEKLRIFMLPTLALMKVNKVEDYVVGFDELGGTDSFSTDMLRARIARSGVINWDGNAPEADGGKSRLKVQSKRNVRQSANASDSDED
eukprot:jgi/Chlat1/2414/Chrsp17S02664